MNQMDGKSKDEELREKISQLIKEHYHQVHKPKEEFIPGKTFISHAAKVYDETEMVSLADSCLDFWLTSGRFTNQFEREFADFLGAKHCLLVNSGSSANLLALTALTSPELNERQLKPGDEVIAAACAFPTTVNPIVQNNLIPVFVDVDLETYNIQSDKIEEALSDKTKAIFLAHSLGNPFNLEKVLSLAKKYDLWVIEDNCDALGSKFDGKYTGTFGDISTYSFYPAHHITMGEGGALVTNNPLLNKLIASFRDWGRHCWCETGCDNTCGKRFDWQLGNLPLGYDHKFIYSHRGYNLKPTDMQAAIGVAQLKKLPGFIEVRQKNWDYFCGQLKRYENFFILPKPTDSSHPSWFGFSLTVRENAPFSRNDITKYLNDHRIGTRLIFSGNIIRHPSFDGVKFRIPGNLDNTDYIMNNTFWFGVHPGIDRDRREYVIKTVEEFLKAYAGR